MSKARETDTNWAQVRDRIDRGETGDRRERGPVRLERVERLGVTDAVVLPAPGTSEDIAMLLADELGAELIVAVGTHATLVEFLDKGRQGMASTFLTRLRVGSKLVDAKGVSLLYPGYGSGSLTGRVFAGSHFATSRLTNRAQFTPMRAMSGPTYYFLIASDRPLNVQQFGSFGDGLWSQYLEVAIGPDAEVFSKSPVLSAVGPGAEIGVRSDSPWNNPEPEVVLAISARGAAAAHRVLTGQAPGTAAGQREGGEHATRQVIKPRVHHEATPFLVRGESDAPRPPGSRAVRTVTKLYRVASRLKPSIRARVRVGGAARRSFRTLRAASVHQGERRAILRDRSPERGRWWPALRRASGTPRAPAPPAISPSAMMLA